MPMIRPSSDLRNKYNEISDFCHTYGEPVFLTKNGTGDLVVMTNAQYEALCGRQELAGLLEEGLQAKEKGPGKEASLLFAELGKKYGL